MTEIPTICPNCKQNIIQKTGLFSNSNTPKKFSQEKFDLISKYVDFKENMFCNNCFTNANYQALRECEEQKNKTEKKIELFEQAIPILSIQNIPNWNYEVITIITGQGTMGTGFLTEWKSSWGDMLGVESSSVNSKISQGESICFKQMRRKCVALNGNAIIGVDVDYAEVGGAKAMMMVCTAGTAVKVTNIEVFSNDYRDMCESIKTDMVKLKEYHNDSNQLNSTFESNI